jgi:hypothetical protein
MVVTALVKNDRILERTSRASVNKEYVLCKALGLNIDYNSDEGKKQSGTGRIKVE